MTLGSSEELSQNPSTLMLPKIGTYRPGHRCLASLVSSRWKSSRLLCKNYFSTYVDTENALLVISIFLFYCVNYLFSIDPPLPLPPGFWNVVWFDMFSMAKKLWILKPELTRIKGLLSKQCLELVILKLKADEETARNLKHKVALTLLMPNGPYKLGQVLECINII